MVEGVDKAHIGGRDGDVIADGGKDFDCAKQCLKVRIPRRRRQVATERVVAINESAMLRNGCYLRPRTYLVILTLVH